MANRTPGVTEKLTEQAMQEFLTKGFTGASLRTIAENAGTSPRAVYTRYGDKEGLFAALVSEQAETLIRMFLRFMGDYNSRPVEEQRQLFHDEAFDAEYKDYYVYMAFSGCELDHVDMTPEAVLVNFQTDITGIYVRYEIDGKLYRALYDEENKVYTLIPADK